MHARADQLFHELAGENPDDFHVDIISQGDNGPSAETVAQVISSILQPAFKFGASQFPAELREILVRVAVGSFEDEEDVFGEWVFLEVEREFFQSEGVWFLRLLLVLLVSPLFP